MRKAMLVAIGSCVVASMLFFLAPAFRQAFRVSLAQWHYVLHIDPQYREPGLEALARRAEQKHDAEALVVVAVRHWDASERKRLAEEAVRLDQNLTWVYAMVYACSPRPSELDQRVQKLERWDPQNALPYLITAECIDIDQEREKIPQRAEDESPAWRSALAAAFQSPKLDTYLKRLKELGRRVAFRYGIDDPYQALETENLYGLPSYAAWDSSRYAHLLLESGDMLEARGDRKSAVEKYWAVARFGQTIGSAGGLIMMSRRLQEAYKRLGALSQKEGKNEQAELYAYLAGKVDQAEKEERASYLQRANGGAVSRWNANVVRISGLLMLFSGGLALICVLSVIAKVRSLRLSTLRLSRIAVTLAIGSVTGLLLSSAMLYVSYRPYAEIFRAYVRNGDESRISELTEFLAYTQVPPGVGDWYELRNFVFYFWFAVSVLCVIALLLVVLGYFHNRQRASATT